MEASVFTNNGLFFSAMMVFAMEAAKLCNVRRSPILFTQLLHCSHLIAYITICRPV